MLFTVGTALAAGAMSCTPVDGVGRLLNDDTNWIIVGEMHGTNETPEAFANLVCLATRTNRPVTVAVEYSSDFQFAIDQFLVSDGGLKAQEEFLKLPNWQSGVQDGRTSIAMLRLFETLRLMRQFGAIKGVVASDRGQATLATLERDAAMAEAWQNISTTDNGIVLVLTGNVHSMRNPWVLPDGIIETAGSLMPAAHTITVNVVGNGGEAWNCQDDGCGVHRSGRSSAARASLDFSNNPDSPWTVTYELGVPTTAAPPAVQIDTNISN